MMFRKIFYIEIQYNFLHITYLQSLNYPVKSHAIQGERY